MSADMRSPGLDIAPLDFAVHGHALCQYFDGAFKSLVMRSMEWIGSGLTCMQVQTEHHSHCAMQLISCEASWTASDPGMPAKPGHANNFHQLPAVSFAI